MSLNNYLTVASLRPASIIYSKKLGSMPLAADAYLIIQASFLKIFEARLISLQLPIFVLHP
jgi:hypothetical protein